MSNSIDAPLLKPNAVWQAMVHAKLAETGANLALLSLLV